MTDLLTTYGVGLALLWRAVLASVLAISGMIAVSRATAMIMRGTPVELRPLFGGLGGGQGGWRLSGPASLLLIAVILFASAVGFAPVDFQAKARQHTDTEAIAKTAPKPDTPAKGAAPENAPSGPASGGL